MEKHYLGLMSGTSMDGVDAALLDLGSGDPKPRLIHALCRPIAPPLRQNLLEIVENPYRVDLDELGSLDSALGVVFAETALELIDEAGIPAKKIAAIGSHGQTIRHRPEGEHPFTWQIADPNIIAARTKICTVADFRRRDMAVGGQGAPLVPLFHQTMFANSSETRIVVNIGGVANLTLLVPDQSITGFDSGPGNVLMDAWMRRQRNESFDRDGIWAASGSIHRELLDALLSEPYFEYRPPKSTGQELFNINWVLSAVEHLPSIPAPEDVQATLCELTAQTIADAVDRESIATQRDNRVLLCGGGAHNQQLVGRLDSLLPAWRVETTAAHGLEPDWVEAAAFAWLAERTICGKYGNVPTVTGARVPVVLGAIYQAFS